MGRADTGRAHLTGRLEEFREALELEISAARRASSSSAVPLINGRLVGHLAEGYQYAFSVENPLNAPGGMPADLIVPDRGRFDVVVVSVDGLRVTLSVPQSLGDFVPRARLQSDLTMLMQKLIERIEDLAGRPNPIGDLVLGEGRVKGRTRAVEVDALNPEQRAAVASSLSRNITYVWGPPGTGKTRTIGEIGSAVVEADWSTLLVSHTNTAVDQALLHIASSVPAALVEDGRIIRVGAPSDQRVAETPNLLLRTHVERRSEALTAERDRLSADLADARATLTEVSRMLGLAEWVSEATPEVQRVRVAYTSIEQNLNRLSESVTAVRELESMQESMDLLGSQSRDLAEQRAKGLRAEERLEGLHVERAAAAQSIEAAQQAVTEAEQLLLEIESLGGLTRRWRRLPDPATQQEVVETRRDVARSHQNRLTSIEGRVERARAAIAAAESAAADFEALHGMDVFAARRRVDAYRDELTRARRDLRSLKETDEDTRVELDQHLTDRLRLLAEWDLVPAPEEELGAKVRQLEEALKAASATVSEVDIRQLRAESVDLGSRIAGMESRLAEIDELLAAVEETVIAEAQVVATTLTRAYLRDAIQGRRFDTVVLDEASMAPVPALWVAASTADRGAVVVGDPRQLPPIVLAEEDMAQRWLGRDVFEVAGVLEDGDRDHVVQLRRQYRMHPAISRIPNRLFYEEQLIDGVASWSDEGLDSWYDRAWGFDDPVLVVDTSELDAWVTAVARGRGSSRLNFLSAAVCVDIANRMLLERRDDRPPAESPRILVVSPYRPHARLVQLLLDDEGISGEVTAGTAHSFQGSEADAVILDLVNDEPHWKVGMFVPAYDESNRRLLNVGLTRARHRLIVVGDVPYIKKLSKKAFVGRRFLPLLVSDYPMVGALEVVPAGLAERSARAHELLSGGDVAEFEDRVVMTQDHVYPALVADLRLASSRVVIYSPFITSNRLAELQQPIRGAVDRGVRVVVVTKALEDRGKRELAGYKELEATLRSWGAVVVHKRGMHEKLVFVDDDLLWSGSLNPLSYSSTQEVMERRRSKTVAGDYAKTLRLPELLEQYLDGGAQCPICEGEMIAAEGRDEPYYWRCVEPDCYTRSIDQPILADGEIKCHNCDGVVEFGSWGERYAWRCTVNKKHRQWIAKSHLKLPKMRQKVPKGSLRDLEKALGLE